MKKTSTRVLGGATALSAAALAGAVAIAGGAPVMQAHTGAKVRIAGPAPGAVVTGNTVPVRVAIGHFSQRCDLAGTADKKGVGHYHVLLDRALIDMYCGPRADVSLQNVAPGRHEIEVVPAENAHVEDMGAARKTSFVYKPASPLPAITAATASGRPSIEIVSPAPGATVHGGFDMRVNVRNFNLSCALYGKTNVAGYGHWHANVDTAKGPMGGMMTMLGMSCAPTFHVSLAGIKPGTHRFLAVLQDNQHAPTPKVQASVTVKVR